MLRVLIIVDSASLRALFATAIARADYLVSTAATASDGLRACQHDPKDIVITDITDPEFEGMRVISTIRQSFPSTGVIAISDHSPGAAIYTAMAQGLGVHAILLKPFSMIELTAAVRQVESRLMVPAPSA